MQVIAIGGEPATGKSCLMKALMPRLGDARPFQYGLVRGSWHDERKAFVLGIYNGKDAFDGTDRLSMAVQKDAEKFISMIAEKYAPETAVIFEGDRLFNQSFLSACREKASRSKFLLLTVENPEELKERHTVRGDSQSEKFLKGRATKYRNLLEKVPGLEKMRNELGDDQGKIIAGLIEFLEGK